MSTADGSLGSYGSTTPGESRLPARIIAVGLLAGLVAGGVAGALVGSAQSRTYQATTIASVLPDDALTTAAAVSGTASTEDPSDVIQGELVVITSQGVRGTVQRTLRLAALPDITASQSGTTDIVDITATAATPALARQIADTTRTVYAQQRAQELIADVALATTQVENQITAVRKQIAATPGAAADPNGALEAEYGRLLAVDSQLALDSAQSSRAVSTVQTAADTGGGLSDTTTYGLGGAVLGILIAAVGLVLLRRARPRVYGLGDLAGLGADVLAPALPVTGPRATRSARVLAGGLRSSGDRSAVVLVATDGGSGSHDAAAALAVAFCDAGPVLLLARPGASSRLPARTTVVGPERLSGKRAAAARLAELAPDGLIAVRATAGELAAMVAQDLLETAAAAGWTVVADAPPLGESRLGLSLAERSGSATLLIARGGADPGDVAASVAALRGAGIPRVGLLLHERLTLRARVAQVRRSEPVAAAERPTPGPLVSSVTAAPPPPGRPAPSPGPDADPGHDAIRKVRPVRSQDLTGDEPVPVPGGRLRGGSS